MHNEYPPPPLESQTILVVDDDPNIVRLIRSYLEQAGYHVEQAADGDGAVAAVRRVRPALVILDLGLPGKDGIEVTRTLRADALLAATPILMLTARIDDVDRILGLEMGADDYVTKPFNPREVLARIKAILRRAHGAVEQAVSETLVVENLALDSAAHAAKLGGRLMELTPSEFDILRLLMRHPGRAFSRTEIIELGLGYEYAGLERTVDSHIKNLRRKLDGPADNSPGASSRYTVQIETVFGVGYRLTARSKP